MSEVGKLKDSTWGTSICSTYRESSVQKMVKMWAIMVTCTVLLVADPGHQESTTIGMGSLLAYAILDSRRYFCKELRGLLPMSQEVIMPTDDSCKSTLVYGTTNET